ncbi:hypothetical protein SAMN05443270_3088 [Lacrimispora sphenoides]|uniref:hypothetical protein n=1 Tax=Lacrimispora sphenoides TaxID=29370 RepID=UPI0008B166F7|nr:hypothetical protein [Lacrimispora sphenoides]SEU09387.1 hypothetical protein SAMN05443270_3088 [Lacrimispora sphenoides]
MYIIKDSNDRYFVQWIGSIPVFNGDISSAKVLNEKDANKAIRSLKMIIKGNYEKILCDEEFIKRMNRDNPEWYRQQIEELLKQYEQKSKDTYNSNGGAYLIYKQIIDDLETVLYSN